MPRPAPGREPLPLAPCTAECCQEANPQCGAKCCAFWASKGLYNGTPHHNFSLPSRNGAHRARARVYRDGVEIEAAADGAVHGLAAAGANSEQLAAAEEAVRMAQARLDALKQRAP
jgi:hypothetical protein